jgi:2-iminobutanoate/2-iminopropanoate deaminase
VGIDPSSGKLAEGGVAEQTRQALANVAAVLGDCGASLNDVAKTTVFLIDMGDFPVMNEVYADVFAGHRPSRSTVAVAALPLGARVEVEVWAYAPR